MERVAQVVAVARDVSPPSETHDAAVTRAYLPAMGSFRHPRSHRRGTNPRLPRRAKVFSVISLGSIGFVFARVVLSLNFAIGQLWAILGNGPGHAGVASTR